MFTTIGNWLYWLLGIGGTGPLYGFWSGFGSDMTEFLVLGSIIGWLHHKNCHVKGCWRLGKHAVDGTPHVVCRRHHPNDAPTADQVLADHRDAAGHAGPN